MITSPTSPTLVVEPTIQEMVTSPTSAVASVLISMKTPLRSPTACLTAVSVPVAPSTVVSTGLVDFSEVARLPEVAEVENDYIGDLVDSFYKGLGTNYRPGFEGLDYAILKVKGGPLPWHRKYSGF